MAKKTQTDVTIGDVMRETKAGNTVRLEASCGYSSVTHNGQTYLIDGKPATLREIENLFDLGTTFFGDERAVNAYIESE